ncbi:MAG: DUF3500 domain-containing protein [Pirellulales bacterium]
MLRRRSFLAAMAAAWPALSYARTLSAKDATVDSAAAAKAWLELLTPDQRKTATLSYDDPKRTDWHYIPKAARKGLQLKEMTEPQKQAAFDPMRSVTSQEGYDKALKIMAMEIILREIEAKKGGGNVRDPERYFFTVFGEPTNKGNWGLSIEGHHISFNMAWQDGKILDSTPTFFGLNPSIVKTVFPGTSPEGTRVLAKEEDLAWELLDSLDAAQRKGVIVSDKAPKDIQDGAKAQTGELPARGMGYDKLNDSQRKALKALVAVYAANLPQEVVDRRLKLIDDAGWEKVSFSWQGAQKPGIGHHYIIQGPTFLIEHNNVQSDIEGRIAHHIHSVWRDLGGDFGLDRKA